jgi:3-mercaptopropionate dioxygenase
MSRDRAARLAPLQSFIRQIETLVERTGYEDAILRDGEALLRDLIAVDDWLPDSHAEPSPERYRQYLLHRDPAARFSIVSFVWGPGQSTPIHDHTVWGLIGVLRGAEVVDRYEFASGRLQPVGRQRLERGEVDAVSPTIGDLHRVSNAYADRVSISIHVYGADIGEVRRSVYQEDGSRKAFISGYADAPALDLPSLDLEALA